MYQTCLADLDTMIETLPQSKKYRQLLYDARHERYWDRFQYAYQHLQSPEIQYELKNPELAILFAKPFRRIKIHQQEDDGYYAT